MDSMVKSYVDKNIALQILDKHIKKTIKKDYSLISQSLILCPYFVFNNRISLKRAFKLKPRIIEHLYWVNAVDGSLIRTKDIPELHKCENGNVQQVQINKEKCRMLSRENAFKHTIRFYKTFWAPEIEAEYKGEIYIPFWNTDIHLADENKQQTFIINGFSGTISKQAN